VNHADHQWQDCPELNPKPRYYGPCRAGLHPEFGWGTPCLNDATEYVEVHTQPSADVLVSSLMRLCSDHSVLASLLVGFHSRKPLAPPALTYQRPVSS
jgi:hypothetical protein